jgi:hypothetical protein
MISNASTVEVSLPCQTGRLGRDSRIAENLRQTVPLGRDDCNSLEVHRHGHRALYNWIG